MMSQFRSLTKLCDCFCFRWENKRNKKLLNYKVQAHNGILEEELFWNNIFENLAGKGEKMITERAAQKFQMNIVS